MNDLEVKRTERELEESVERTEKNKEKNLVLEGVYKLGIPRDNTQ